MRFRNYVKPEFGKKTIHYGQAYDPHIQWANEMVHGNVSKPSHIAGDLLNPQPETRFRQAKVKICLYAFFKNTFIKTVREKREYL